MDTIFQGNHRYFNRAYLKKDFTGSCLPLIISVRVADSFFMRTPGGIPLYRRILQSPLEAPGKYIYSDNDFIFLGHIVEAISGMPLEEYVYKEFYRPLGLVTAGFRPLNRFPKNQVAPTESEKIFRRQLIHGYVHDPGAAMFGGVAGHAGLFSNAYDIAVLMQLFLNKGVMNGRRYISDTTIEKFTAYHSEISRRGLGFDKPEKDNLTRKEPYPTLKRFSLNIWPYRIYGNLCLGRSKREPGFYFLI